MGASLVGRDLETQSLRIHRLLQVEYRMWIGEVAQVEYFAAAIKLLCGAFPKSVNGLPLRSQWSSCRKYIQHALALCSTYVERKSSTFDTQCLSDFATLLTSCGW